MNSRDKILDIAPVSLPDHVHFTNKNIGVIAGTRKKSKVAQDMIQ